MKMLIILRKSKNMLIFGKECSTSWKYFMFHIIYFIYWKYKFFATENATMFIIMYTLNNKVPESVDLNDQIYVCDFLP